MSKRTKIIVGTVLAVVVLAVAAAALLVLTRDEAPEAVDLETAVALVEAAPTSSSDGGRTTTADDDAPTTGASTDAGEDVSTVSSTEPRPDASTEASEPADTESTSVETESSGLAGVWTVQTAEGTEDLLVEPAVSFAGFRVDEVLAGGIGDFTAVGRTADVSGTIELTATALVAVTVEVNLNTLRTDNSNRDGRARQALGANEFPVATFTLVEALDLPAGITEGETFSGSAVGELTIKGVTNPAAFDLEARLVGDTIVVVGSSEVIFADYGVTAPTAPIVVSVEDHGIMEFQLLFTR